MSEDDEPDGPDLSDEDMVEVDPDVAAEVAGETAEEEGDQEADADQADGADEEATDLAPTEDFGDVSIGNTYCQTLGLAATLARQRKGSGLGDQERNDLADEYADMARQVDLDQLVDKWVAENMGAGEISTGQGIILGTSIFGMMVLLDDPELAENLTGEVGV